MNYLAFRLSLFKLHRERRKLRILIPRAAQEARRTGGESKARQVWDDAAFDFDEIDDKILGLITSYLVSKANQNFLPTPSVSDENEMWERCNFTGIYHLTDKGIREVREIIRKEINERMEMHSFWVPWLGLLIGLIGAITGLIAVIKK